MADKYLKVTLIRSTNKKLENHKKCVRGLGLRKLNSVAKVEDTSAVRGMINKVKYLLKVEEVK